MKPGFLLVGCTVATLWTPVSPVRAEQPAPTGYTAADPFEALQKAVRAEREAKARAGSSSGGGSYYDTRGFVENIRQFLSQGDDANALSMLNQLESVTTTEDVRRACGVLADKINKDRTARTQAFNAELEAAIKHASEQIVQAKEPKELDATIENFNRLAEVHNGLNSNGRDNRTTQKIQGTTNFLCRWQEYLFALAKGEERNAGNILRNLTENNYNNTLLIPRSEILARQPDSVRNNNGDDTSARSQRTTQETNAAVAEILDATHSLDEIPGALAKLDALARKANGSQNRSSDNNTDLGAATANLQSLQKTQSELRAGLATTISMASLRPDNSNARPAVENRLAGLRAEVLKLALPRLMGAPDVNPNAGEGAAGFLRRLIDAAKQRGDWASVARGLEINRSFGSSQNSYNLANAQETEAFKSFFSGLNLEAAGQYQQAVINYLNALKSGVQDLPSAAIGEHLAAIEKAHPKEFAEANTYILTPPTSQYQNSSSAPRINRRSNSDANEQSTPPPTITVPAATPAPTASPSPTPTPVPSPKS